MFCVVCVFVCVCACVWTLINMYIDAEKEVARVESIAFRAAGGIRAIAATAGGRQPRALVTRKDE